MVNVYEIKKRSNNETALVLLCIRSFFKTSSEKEIKNFINSNKINWDFFQQVVSHHKVKSIVYRELLKVELPQEQEANFKFQLVQLTTKVQKQIKQTFYIVNLLKGCNINVIPFKGFVLSDLLYNKLDYRDSVDIDLAIDPLDLPAVVTVLKSEGYKFAKEQVYNLNKPEKYVYNNSDAVFYKKGFFSIEFHWRVNQVKVDFNDNSAIINIHNHTCKTIKNQNAKVLNSTEHFKQVFLHHIFSDGLYKIQHWLELTLVLDKIKKEKKGFESVFFDSYFVDEKLLSECIYYIFGIDYRKNTTEGVSKKAITIINKVFNVKFNTTKNYFYPLTFIVSRAVKLNLLFQFLKYVLKPCSYDFDTLKLPKSLNFLYYFIKPFRFFFKSVKTTTV